METASSRCCHRGHLRRVLRPPLRYHPRPHQRSLDSSFLPRSLAPIQNPSERSLTASDSAADVDVFYQHPPLDFDARDSRHVLRNGYADETWGVVPAVDEVPTALPQPTHGINFTRNGTNRREWLVSIAFFAARLNWDDRRSSEKLTMGTAPLRKEASRTGEGHSKVMGSSAASSNSNQAQPKRAPAPHMFRAIVADEKTTTASALEDQVYTGIFLARKTKKYWVDERTRHNCFMLFPRGLSITSSENPEYWTWYPLKEESDADTQIEVASLKNVVRLEIHGRLELSYLTPGVTYQVVFQVMLTDPAYEWSVPVNLQLKFPDGTVHQHEENLQEKLRRQWLELMVGEVNAQLGQTGEIDISLFEYGGRWKRGLLIKGIKILPKQRSSEKLTIGTASSRQEASHIGEGHSKAVGSSAASSNSNQAQSKRAPAPHMFQAIVANEKTTTASALEDQVYTGIILDGKKKMYWVDERTRHNCFMLFPRGLTITWSEDPRYWTWYHLKEESYADTQIEVASLKDVCWLDIHGQLELSYLTPGVTYEVVFQVMLTDPSYGWSSPVNLQLKFPDGTVHQHKENLQEKLRWWWLALKVGEVEAQQGQTGVIDISLREIGSQWKSGLHIKGIKILPKQ
ncbi:hypothetical protein ABZP36_025448 [Zizania latifolia]